MNIQHYQKIVKASAIYDLVVTLPFATPWTFQVIYQILNKISPLPSFAPTHMLFVNLFGSIVIVWSVLRIRHPEPIYGLYDSVGRALFSTWFIYYLVAYGVHPATWIFAMFEIIWFIIQGMGFLKLYAADVKQPTISSIN